jgi:hypothetical protein
MIVNPNTHNVVSSFRNVSGIAAGIGIGIGIGRGHRHHLSQHTSFYYRPFRRAYLVVFRTRYWCDR